MAKGYVIGQIDITDMDSYANYRAEAPKSIEQYGGTYLVRGGKMETIEGEPTLPRTVVLEFPTFDEAKAWYYSEEYQGVVGLRHAASHGTMFLVEGHD
jgi:uncharacterized protein (DUF1330 family)